MEERKVKIQRDKQMIIQSRVRSIMKHQHEIMNMVGELKSESRARVEQILEMKEKVILGNQHLAKETAKISPYKQLEERRQKLLKENRH